MANIFQRFLFCLEVETETRKKRGREKESVLQPGGLHLLYVIIYRFMCALTSVLSYPSAVRFIETVPELHDLVSVMIIDPFGSETFATYHGSANDPAVPLPSSIHQVGFENQR